MKMGRFTAFQIPPQGGGSPVTSKFQGSLAIEKRANISQSEYSLQKKQWLKHIQDNHLLDRYTPSTWTFSERSQQAFLNWGLEHWPHFIPILRAVNPLETKASAITEHMANVYNIKKSVTTIPILGEIAVDLLQHLPSTHSMEDALAQFTAVLSAVNKTAFNASKNYRYNPNTPIQLNGFSDLYRLDGDGLIIGPFNDHLEPRIYSSIQRSQIVFISKNGAMQIVKLPSPKELSWMIQKDETAKRYLDQTQHLSRRERARKSRPRQLPTYDTKMDASATIQLLERFHQNGIPPDRIAASGWTDLHQLLEVVPFNFKQHIQDGRLSVLLDKPNDITQQGVWDV